MLTTYQIQQLQQISWKYIEIEPSGKVNPTKNGEQKLLCA